MTNATIDMNIALTIAAEYKNGTELSERKMAEKHGVPRSRIQKIKKEVLNGVWDEALSPKEKEVETKVIKSNVKLTRKTHQKAPTKKSYALYTNVFGDYDSFASALLEANETITTAYINSEYHRCVFKASN
ncbi:MAG: hypothetical protein [Caudoviricetes sp.]|nr:MAG: hypothetical protein [Caudoviricetes sp.]